MNTLSKHQTGHYLFLSIWKKHRSRSIAKIISLVVTLTFIFPYLTWAFEPEQAAKAGAVLLDGRQVEIPQDLGTVTESFQGTNRLVVYVQDLHCNNEVQTHIASLIGWLAEKYGLKLVTVEGNSSSIDAGPFRAFPDARARDAAARYLVREGLFTGAELYAITGKRTVALEGIEQAELYRADRNAVMKFLNDENQGYLFDLREALDGLKDGLYNQELKKLDARKIAYRQGAAALAQYAAWLAKYAAGRKLGLGGYPMLARYLGPKESLGAGADADHLSRELELLDRELRLGLYTSPEQKELDALEQRLDIMEKLLNISATPEELAEFRSNRGAFRVQGFQDFIVRHLPEGEPGPDPEIANLDAGLEQTLEFYRVADQRSQILVKNAARQMQAHGTNLCVMITGGYHVPEALAELKKQNLSYICLQPRLTHQDLVNPYFSLLRGRKTPLGKIAGARPEILALATNVDPAHQALFDFAAVLFRAAATWRPESPRPPSSSIWPPGRNRDRAGAGGQAIHGQRRGPDGCAAVAPWRADPVCADPTLRPAPGI